MRELYREDFIHQFLGNNILVPGTSHIYELDLAIGELKSLRKEELIERGAYFWKIDDKETYHHRICVESPLQVDTSSTMRRKTFFVFNQFKTGYATHGLFPYRGKFHPQLIKAIMNIIGLKKGETVLDSMTGSGTVNVEASIIGVSSIGIDMSPFCILMSKTKVAALDVDTKKLDDYAEDTMEVYDLFEKERKPRILEDFIEGKVNTSQMRRLETDDDFYDLFKLAYFDAMGYAQRRKNKTPKELFPIIIKRYVAAIKSFSKVKEELNLSLAHAKIYQGDARSLDLDEESVDGIIISPPYSFAIDYVENDLLQLEYLGINIQKLKRNMIGLYGNTRNKRVKNYFKDMKKVISEFSRVLKAGRCCVIVIGSNERQTGGIRHEIAMKKFAAEYKLNLFKELVRPISGIRNVMRNEYVLFFVKQ